MDVSELIVADFRCFFELISDALLQFVPEFFILREIVGDHIDVVTCGIVGGSQKSTKL